MIRGFCAVAVADHDGRLDQLEERLVGELADRTGSREGPGSKLSHLADRRSAMAPEAYRADLCDPVVLEDYALEHEEETLPWSRAPAGQAELVEGAVLALEAECRAFQLDYPAGQALEQLAWPAVGRPVITRTRSGNAARRSPAWSSATPMSAVRR